jgi:archaellin
MMKKIGTATILAALLVSPALAQTLPPTSQQMQQQSNQTIQNESNAAHNNLNQTQSQIQQQSVQPSLSTSGHHTVAHPPGYIPMPNK